MGYTKVRAPKPDGLIMTVDIRRYFHQRHSIFSRYDDGIWMTEDAWFGVTPEPVAEYVYVTGLGWVEDICLGFHL